MSSSNCPVATSRLEEIVQDACTVALGSAQKYDDSKVLKWNTKIIQSTLQSLLGAQPTSSSSTTPETSYKYIVNSTIIQHDPSPRTSSAATSSSTTTEDSTPLTPPLSQQGATTNTTNATPATAPHVRRRAMHCASGAYWNSEKDGSWSYKYEGEGEGGMSAGGSGRGRGFDVVVNVIWVAV